MQPTQKNNCFVLTGGPGSGKSTLIAELRSLGFRCVDEVGRQLIQVQQNIGGDALPWENKSKFRDLMFSFDLLSFDREPSTTPVVFDRGFLDSLGYSRLEGLSVGDDLLNAAKQYRYNAQVFVAPPWQEIYENDQERKQDFAEIMSLVDLPMVRSSFSSTV